MNRVLYIIIISNRYIKVLKKKIWSKESLGISGVIINNQCWYICCQRWISKTSCTHAHVVIEEEAGDEKLLSPRLYDDEMTSLKVVAHDSSVISGSYGGSPSDTLFWTTFCFYFNSWIYLLKRNVIICVIFYSFL